MACPNAFEQHIQDGWPRSYWEDVTTLVAVSGGPDSVALLTALARMHPNPVGNLLVAHYNHRVRKRASDEDQRFVANLAMDLGLEFVSETLDGPATCATTVSESEMRSCRYAFLEATAKRHGARYVATGHTLDDQVETILHNVIRGTGLTGLAGIPRTRQLNEAVTLVRPMLDRSRREVLEYLGHIGVGYRQDDSNFDLRYTRNRIRHQLLPDLENEFNRDVREAIARLGEIADEAVDFVFGQVERLESRCVTGLGTDCVHVDCQVLSNQHRLLVRQLLASIWRRSGWPEREMGFVQWRRLASFVFGSDDASASFPNGIMGRRTGKILELRRSVSQDEGPANAS